MLSLHLSSPCCTRSTLSDLAPFDFSGPASPSSRETPRTTRCVTLTAQAPTFAAMPTSKYSAMNGILFALGILPAFVNGYDCSSMSKSGACSHSDSLTDYSVCMVKTFSISAFMQCASQNGGLDYAATRNGEGGIEHISALNVLTYAVTTPNGLTTPACGNVPLAVNIPKAAREHGSESFAKYLCRQYHPLNGGLCCLRKCLLLPTAPEEHSIEAFCAGKVQDLMKAPTLPNTCGADLPHTCGDGLNDDGSGDVEPAAAASSSDLSSPTEQATSSSSGPKQSSSSSTRSTTSSTASSATSLSATRTSTSPPVQVTPSTGAVYSWWETGSARLNRLGLTVLLILAVMTLW